MTDSMIDHEILFRKFTIRKRSNHRKHIPHLRYVTLDTFEAHKKIVKGMMKCEKTHNNTNSKQTIKLVRLEKKWLSFKRKLEGVIGRVN